MLPKRRRLNSKEVAVVLSRGRSRRAVFLSMKLLEVQTPCKTSVVVAKAVARKATERNRLRRAVYRVLNSPLFLQTYLPSVGHAVVFVQKAPPADLTQLFGEDIKTLFKNIK